MAPVGSGGDEFAELMTYHILCHIDRNMLSAIVNRKCVSHKTRQDRRTA